MQCKQHLKIRTMKKTITLLFLLVLSLTFIQCKQSAAEDRVIMHQNAKRVSDSIAKAIDDALAQGAIPGTATTTVVDTTHK